MKTNGERALESLDAFHAIYQNPNEGPTDMTDQFITSNLEMMAKFPTEYRVGFRKLLPFSLLEQTMIERTEWHRIEPIRIKVASRLGDWVTFMSVYIDDRNASCSDYLMTLSEHLDRWEDRERAHSLAIELSPHIS